MSQFEYLSIAVSIIFALSIGRLVVALPEVVASERRDWLHLGHFICLLLAQMQFWWRMWVFNAVEVWDFLGFSMLFSVALLYYLATHLLVPRDHAAVSSWRAHFGAAHRWYHGIVGLAWACSVGIANYLMGIYAVPAPMPIMVILFFTAIFFNRRWFHSLVLAAWALLLVTVSVALQGGAA